MKAPNIYEELGYTDRENYLESLSEDFGIDIETIKALADILGEEEDFDGLVTALEDMDY